MSEKSELQERLRNVIVSTCNKTGCKECGLKFDGGCAATDLEHRIMDIELSEEDSQ